MKPLQAGSWSQGQFGKGWPQPGPHKHPQPLLMDSLAVLPPCSCSQLLAAPTRPAATQGQPWREDDCSQLKDSSGSTGSLGKTAQYHLVTLQKGQHTELHPWSGVSTLHTGAQLWSSQGWSLSHSQAWYPRDPAEGAGWQQGRQVWLDRNTTFQCYPWSISRDSTGHLRDLTPDTRPSQRIQLTARAHLVLGKDESSKCHSSSAVTPCLS